MDMIFPSKIELVRSTLIPVLTPQFTLMECKFDTLDLIRILPELLHCKLIEMSDGYRVKHYDDILHLTHYYLRTMLVEWHIWTKHYLPSFGLEGKTILDVGAGCGETAHFFFKYGAEKVVAIEPNLTAINLLEENIARNDWNVEIITRGFRLSDLRIPHDFMKMDGEGCESELLKTNHLILKPCLIEAHGEILAQELTKKFNLQMVHKMSNLFLLK